MSTTNRKKNLKLGKNDQLILQNKSVETILERISAINKLENIDIKKWVKIPKQEMNELKNDLNEKQKSLFLQFINYAKENNSIKIMIKFLKR